MKKKSSEKINLNEEKIFLESAKNRMPEKGVFLKECEREFGEVPM